MSALNFIQLYSELKATVTFPPDLAVGWEPPPGFWGWETLGVLPGRDRPLGPGD